MSIHFLLSCLNTVVYIVFFLLSSDGYEATMAIRAAGIRVPVIAVTGNALDEDQRRFVDAGASTVLTKPVRREVLEQVLREVRFLRVPHAHSSE